MNAKRFLFWALVGTGLLSVPQGVSAHCPLCTIGAGLAATIAVWLGINIIVVGIFIGAFAIALGLWIGRLIKKQYFKYQKISLGLISFFATVLPLQPLLESYTSIYISWSGEYGSLLNRTYVIDRFLFGSALGAIIVIAAPYFSNLLTRTRAGKQFSYQGMTITFFLLLGISAIIQFSP